MVVGPRLVALREAEELLRRLAAIRDAAELARDGRALVQAARRIVEELDRTSREK